MLTLVAVAAAASIAAPAQSRPGEPTKGRVWIENRGQLEAIPVTLVPEFQGNRRVPVAVEVANVPTVTVSAERPFETRAARQAWEYRTVQIGPGQNAAETLNVHGGDGWEAVGPIAADDSNVAVLLKRPR
jgi:hypothetical protein